MKERLRSFFTENTHLTVQERDIIINTFSDLRLSKKEFWMKRGEVCESLAFVNSGILRVINEIDEVESTLQLVYENSFITSLTSFAYQTPGIWSIQAITNCELLIIKRADHLKLINQYKNWLEFDNALLLKAYTDLEYRLFSQFHLNAEQRFKKLFLEKPEIFNVIPLKYIASSIGITPETLSRLRKRHLK